MPITDVKKLRKSPGFLLRCAHQLSVAIVAEHLTQLNLTSVQFATLVAVDDHPGLDATRLAAMINFDRPTLTGVIDRLETKGLLVREPDLNDRRARQLFLTPDGEKMLAAATALPTRAATCCWTRCRLSSASSSCCCWRSWWTCISATRRASTPRSAASEAIGEEQDEFQPRHECVSKDAARQAVADWRTQRRCSWRAGFNVSLLARGAAPRAVRPPAD